MNLQKIANSIQREMVANPKKGLVLVLLLVVGLYFWGPILKRWTSNAGSASAAPVIAEDDPLPETSIEEKQSFPGWDKVDAALAQNEFARPLLPTQAATLKNPFASLTQIVRSDPNEVAEKEPAAEQVEQMPIEDLDPVKLGVVVKSVSIGPQGRLAYVRGQVYRLGDKIPLTDEPAQESATSQDLNQNSFELTRIEPWGVVLRRNGKDFTQQLTQPRLSKHDRIAWDSNGPSELPANTD